MSEEREFDIVIFGATGCTGRYVIEELANSTEHLDFKWAVAGRNREKLKESLNIVQNYLKDGTNIRDVTIIIADVTDEESISNMVKRAQLILNCAGPYKLYGEVVVSSCIRNGTHHVDICAEIGFLETIQATYFEAARKKGVFVVQACGLDSIPTDFGISLLKEEFKGDLNSVESYIKIGTGPEGRITNFGTYYSGVISIFDILNPHKYRNVLKEKVFKTEMPESSHRLSHRWMLFYSNIVNSWCIWFPDEHIIDRSQMFRNEFLNERPIQAYNYLRMHSLLYAISYLFFGGIFILFSMCSVGRFLLTKYPHIFTAGTFSKSGPTRKQVEQGYTEVTLCGQGWAEKLPKHTDRHEGKPDKKMTLKMSGPEAAYPLTAMCMVQAGLVVLAEKDKMPLNGGVLTPGVAFQNTTLKERLEKCGMSFHFSS